MSRVIGLDLSLTGTGLAIAGDEAGRDPGIVRVETIKSPAAKIKGHERLERIVDGVTAMAFDCDLAVVEGPSFGSQGNALHQMGGVWWLVTQRLWKLGIPYAIATPSQVKKYLTGKGAGIDKVAMALEFGKRFPGVAANNDNEIDAVVLAAIGKRLKGEPIDSVPAAHLTVMDKIEEAA